MYADTISIPAGISQWFFTLSTFDCSNDILVFDTGWVSGITVITHDFNICVNQNHLPVAITGQASDITAATAVLHGFVNPDSSQTYVTFEFGTTTSYGTFLSCGYFNGDSLYPVSGTISGLQPGTLYHFRINATNSYGTSHGTDTTFITPGNTGCQAYFSSYTDSTSNSIVHFVDQSGGTPVSWSWNFGDPGSGPNNYSYLQNPTHIFSNTDTTYQVCLTIHGADSTCYDTYCDTLYVGSGGGCQAQFTYYQDSVPGDNLVHFIDLSLGTPSSWLWDFGDPASGVNNYSTLQNPIHVFSVTDTTYYVCLTIECQGVQSTWCQAVYIWNNSNCTNYFTYQQSGLMVSFSGFMVNQQPATFSWNLGDGTTATGQSFTHTYANQGIYYVSLTTVTSDSLTCTYTSNQTIQVGDSAQFHQVYGQVFAGAFPLQTGIAMIFSLDSNQNYSPYIATCPIDSSGLYYFSMVPDGNYYVYALPILPAGYLPTYFGDVLQWQDATLIALGQASNPYNINLIAADSGTYGSGGINGQINQGGLKTNLLDKITMILMDGQGSPLGYYKVASDGRFDFASLGFGTYLLRAEIPGVVSDIIQVVLTAEKPVEEVVLTFSGNKILGLDEPAAFLKAGSPYPNPTKENSMLILNSEKQTTVSVEIYDLTGRIVLSLNKEIVAGGNQIVIPASDLLPGIYTVVIRPADGLKVTKKLIKS
jgi:PKD repeat protein